MSTTVEERVLTNDEALLADLDGLLDLYVTAQGTKNDIRDMLQAPSSSASGCIECCDGPGPEHP